MNIPVPAGVGAVIAVVVLVVCIVLMFLRGPDPVLGLIGALAVARLVP